MDHGTTDVSAAFDILLEQIEDHVEQTNNMGAQAFQQGSYEQARQVLERADQLASLRDQFLMLRQEWEDLFGILDAGEQPEEKRDGDPQTPPASFHEACLRRVERHLGKKLQKQSRSGYATHEGDLAVICSVSKEYVRSGHGRYWFAFHTHQSQFLDDSGKSFLALGCGRAEQVLLIPYETFKPWLGSLNTTERHGGVYWHLHVLERGDTLILDRKKGFEKIDLTQYLLQ